MALINEIKEVPAKTGGTTHTPKVCTACYERNVYLLIRTFASDANENASRVSETLRFERAGAIRLLELIGKAFPDLVQ